jgi:hypothetical protein
MNSLKMNAGVRRSSVFVAQGMMLVLLLCVAPAIAQGKIGLCMGPGAEAGDCSSPAGVATDFESGRVYVAERSNNRISVFNSDRSFAFAFGWGVLDGAPELQTCTTVTGCQAGLAGSGAGQFSSPSRVAVDNIPGSASQHSIYVGVEGSRIQKFAPNGEFTLQFGSAGSGVCQFGRSSSPISVGPSGNVFVADSVPKGSKETDGFINRVQKYSPMGACLGETKLFDEDTRRLTGIAVDLSEDAYVTLGGSPTTFRKYDLASPETLLCSDAIGNTNALTLDEAGRIFASQRDPRDVGAGNFPVITEYSSSCGVVQRFGYGEIGANLLGLAAYHSSEGDLFASEENKGVDYFAIPPLGPIVAPGSLEVPSTGNAKATVRAEVNPEGKATEVHVEYVDDASFDSEGGFDSPNTQSTESVAVPAGTTLKLVEVLLGCPTATKELIEEGKCLTPETEYHWRVIATNADNPTGVGEGTAEGPNFETKEPLEIESTFATEVGTDTAVLNAVVNPLGIPATGYFEYVDDASYDAEGGFASANVVKVPNVDAAEAEIDFGSSEEGVRRSAVAFPLQPGTVYHYRFSGTDALIDERQLSEEKTFRTLLSDEGDVQSCPGNEALRFGPSALLPDCRAYELVSPLDKDGGDIIVLTEGLTRAPATLNQSAVSGEKLVYGTYRSFGDSKSAPYTSQYVAERGAGGWESHGISPPQDRLIKEAVEFDNEFRFFSDDLCEGWIVPLAEPPLAEDAIPGYRNLYRRSDSLCGAESYEAFTTAKPENIEGRKYVVELQGVSADEATSAFASNDNLEGTNAPPQPPSCVNEGQNCQVRLYVSSEDQQPVFACILPNGSPTTTPCSAGTGNTAGLGKMRRANVLNALSEDGKRLFWSASAGEGRIYLRENPLGEGLECVEPEAPCTIDVSKVAEEATGTTQSHYWTAAEDGSSAIFSTGSGPSSRLYEFDVETETTTLISEGFLGFAAASEDATRAYFASSKVLSGEEENSEGDKAIAGQPNLYLHEAGEAPNSARFVATLTASDANQLVIPTHTSVTAEEPIRHNSHATPDGEHLTFMSQGSLTGYDNTDAASGKADAEVFLYEAAGEELVCASCNPSGARPRGADVGAPGNAFWIAARLPTYQTTLYAPRMLAADGSRLFFESQDPLVPRDTNGRIDVYQWEQAGTGGCSEARSTFSEEAQGCIDLISSGQSNRDSEFVDASPSGDDVFFATLSSLFPTDFGLVDIYDARVGGGYEPPPPPEPDCEGESCQSPPAAPEYQAPSSATTFGPGNLEEKAAKPKPKRCPKGKHKVKKAGKVRCVKNKKKGGKAKQRQAQGRRAGR